MVRKSADHLFKVEAGENDGFLGRRKFKSLVRPKYTCILEKIHITRIISTISKILFKIAILKMIFFDNVLGFHNEGIQQQKQNKKIRNIIFGNLSFLKQCRSHTF